jgi:hypothetical protein
VRLVVVDPRLLVHALEHEHSLAAKLLSLLIYGLASVRACALSDESNALEQNYRGRVDARQLARARASVDRRRAAALRQKALIEDALEQFVSVELLLVTSPPLRRELRDIAQVARANGSPRIHPHRVNWEIARCTWLPLRTLGPTPSYLGRDRVSPREYLIHTAVVAESQIIITEDDDLVLPGDACQRDPKRRCDARPYTLDEFFRDELPFQLEFDAIDALAVFRAAASSPGA